MVTKTTADPRDAMPIFSDWGDDCVLYVDGRVSRNKARYMVCEEVCGWYRVITAHRCYMREISGAEALEFTDGEYDEFWRICEKADPGAFAMWKVT